MRGGRFDRLLACAALLIICVPSGAVAQEPGLADLPASLAQPAEAPISDTQGVGPEAMVPLDPADRAIAEKIGDLLGSKSEGIFANKNERDAAEAFYRKRNLAPLWLERGAKNARATSAIKRINKADAEGLEVRDYELPNLAVTGPEALAAAELRLTATVLTYARHLQAGRFPYHLVSRNIELPQAPPEPSEVLARIADAADTGNALDAFSPQHEPYQRLKSALAQLRGKGGGTNIQIAQGPVLRYDRKHPMEDARVPALRERLRLGGDPSDLRYDAADAEAVKKYQAANGLPPTGNLDPRTLKQLNGPSHDPQIDAIIANMERWRWYPRDLGDAHVLVNEPDFTLKVIHNGIQVWTTRIVIGKPSMPTPLLSETMKYITINPTWNVPPSIVHNEYLPALAQDPTVLARMGLRVSYRGGIHIWQPPGEGNALGRIRFNFPNRFLVYQHDTPDKYMFGHEVRAYSHGCMRVQDPAKYAEVLFNIARPHEHWTAERIKSMFGEGEQDIQLEPAQVWVHLAYQTAFVDDAGKLQIRRDIYNLDRRTLAAIKSERAIVEPGAQGKHELQLASVSDRRPRRFAHHRSSLRPMLSVSPRYAAPLPFRAMYYR
jgi:murein L,D-transpeptidase YcbB/YkuD